MSDSQSVEWGASAAAVLVAGAAYALAIRLFTHVTPPAVVNKTCSLSLIVTLLLLVVAGLRFGRSWGVTMAMIVASIAFSVPLSRLWVTAETNGSVIGGLLPFSDAAGYYADATRLLEGFSFERKSTSRPLFPGLLAGVLAMTGQNLLLAVASLVFVVSIAVFVLTLELSRVEGTVAAVTALAVLLAFYASRPYAGTTLTENAGLAFGALGLAALCRAAALHEFRAEIAGLFLLTLGLCARAGPFLLLPALIGLASFEFPLPSTRSSRRVALLCTCSVLAGFLIDGLLRKIVGRAGIVPFSNFSYVFYGMISGGNWQQVLLDHPQVHMLREPELTKAIYRLAFARLAAHPFDLLSGALRAWKVFLFDGFVFSFTNRWAGLFLRASSVAGLLFCFRDRAAATRRLLLVASAGIFLSVPFVPPWDSGGMRAYATVIPIFAALPAVAVCELIGLTRSPRPATHGGGALRAALPIVAFALVALTIVSPLVIYVSRRGEHRGAAAVPCPAGTMSLTAHVHRGASLRVVSDESRATTEVPDVRFSDFRRTLPQIHRPDIVAEFMNLPSSSTLATTIETTAGRSVWLFAPQSVLPGEGLFSVCGAFTSVPKNRRFGFFYVRSAHRL